MLCINTSTNSQGAKDYFREQLTRSDYYVKDGQEITGQWHGRGAALLGLSGSVDRESYFRLCDNQDPRSGEQLTTRMKANRRATYDFTWNAPKSVSIAYELGRDERIVDAFRASVRDTMTELENDMRVRVRKDGQFHDRVTGNMVWAEFVHRTTRPLEDGVPDPHLHVHAVAMNLSYDPAEGIWKAGEFGAIKREASYYQAACHARFAGRLSALGYGVERDGNSFRLTGIDRSIVEKFSRRTLLIEAEAKRRDIQDPKEKSTLGRKTRKGKGQETGVEAIRPVWEARLTAAEKSALAQLGRSPARPGVSADAAVAHAAEHSFERNSVVTEKRLRAEALMHGVGSVMPEDVQRAVAQSDVIVKDSGGVQYATTRQVHREELDMIAFARDGRGTRRKLGDVGALEDGLAQEQRRAAEAILNSRDAVIGLRGGAGTGKTRMMQATVKAIEAGGKQVFTFAPSAQASRGVLRSEGFEKADTVERLLTDEKLRKETAGQVLWIDEAGLLSVKDTNRIFAHAKANDCRVILAGDSRQHASVARGDAFRLIETEGGLPFAELKQVRRQTHEAYRQAVFEISQGDAAAGNGRTYLANGIERLDAMGAIAECGSEDRYRQVAADYLDTVAERKRDGSQKTALVVSPTHREAEKVTEEIRAGLRDGGAITGADREFARLSNLNLTTAQRKDPTQYTAGMVIQFHQNAPGFQRGEKITVTGRDGTVVRVQRENGASGELPLAAAERFQAYRRETLSLAAGDTIRITQNGYTKESRRTGKEAKGRLNNGATFAVAGFTRQGDIELTNGFVVPKDYGHLAHGYASTSHSSQGKTVDRVLISMGQESLVAANREQFYVSVSRGREGVQLYTDDKEALKEAVQTSAARISATELLKSAEKPATNSRLAGMQKLVQHTRIRRAYEAVRMRTGGRPLQPHRGYEHGQSA